MNEPTAGRLGSQAYSAWPRWCRGGDDDDDASDVSDANTEFCDDLAAYGSAVADFAALDSATATKDDYESAADEVRSTREDMVDSAEDLAEAEWENLLTQVDTLRDQLRDAPDEQAVQAIVDEAKPQAADGPGERGDTEHWNLLSRRRNDDQR